MLSGAGSTGISLHADQSFEDKRRRHLIFVQASNDIVKVKQMLGRPNRRGQVSIPAVSFVTSGLAAEVRLLAMRNGKFRALSAGTRSNRENSETDKNTPDILNSVGEEACRRFLLENPKVAQLAGINLDMKEVDNYFVNKITGRISLFKQEEAIAYFNQIFGYYDEILTELTNRGENPLNPNMLDVKARVVESFELVGRKGDSVFDSPVVAQQIEWKEFKKPISGDRTLEMARKGLDKITAHPLFKQDYDGYLGSFWLENLRYTEIPMVGFKRAVTQGFHNLKVGSLSKRYLAEGNEHQAIEAALADGSEAISNINEREVWFKKNLNSLTPLHMIEFNYLGESREAMITAINPPEHEKLHYLGQWTIDVVMAGEDRPLNITLNQLRTDPKFQVMPFGGERWNTFIRHLNSDANSDKESLRRRWTMGGNLFKAAEISAQNGYGKSGYYTDESGVFHRAIICPSYIGIEDFMNMITFHSKPEEAADALFVRMESDHSGKEMFSDDAYIHWNSRSASLTVSGSKKTHGDIFLDDEITMRMGDFSGTRKSMTINFEPTRENLLFIMRALYRNNLYLKTGAAPALKGDENNNYY